MHKNEIKLHNVNLADLRAMVHNYDRESLYRAVNELNGANHTGVLGEVQFGDHCKEFVEIQHVSHTIDEFKIVDDMILGNVRILDTPAGRIVRNTLIGSGKQPLRELNFSISSNNIPASKKVNQTPVPVEDDCDNCGSCACNRVLTVNDDFNIIAPAIIYQVLTEPERTVIDTQCVNPETEKVVPCEVVETKVEQVQNTYVAPTYTEPTYTTPSYSLPSYSSDSGSSSPSYSSGSSSYDSGSSSSYDSGSSSSYD